MKFSAVYKIISNKKIKAEKLLVGVMHRPCKMLERSGLSAVVCADNVSNLMLLQIPKRHMDLAFPVSV